MIDGPFCGVLTIPVDIPEALILSNGIDAVLLEDLEDFVCNGAEAALHDLIRQFREANR